MSGKHITPKMKAKIATMRSAGYSLASIADKCDVSISTVKRHIKATPKGGTTQKMLDEARQELISTLTDDEVKVQMASALVDEINISQRIRANIFETLEIIESTPPTDIREAAQTMRALSSASTSLKLTGDTLRAGLGITQRGLHENSTDNLPELVINNLTEEEMEKIREKSESLAAGIDDGMGGILDENDVVEEGFDEPETV